ncbi:MAG TPA: hypothetical protein VJK50_02355, partial [Patescibacteria group bacterium]|nr:hypothetical protein [Patescibacteria group bacterium]
QTSQYTMQWWLRAQHSPFRGPIQFGFQVGQSYEPTEELRYHGAGRVESAWYAVHCTQKPLGIERPLDNGLWLLIGHHMAKQTPVEAGLIAFIDALASYMAGSDEMCVFNLCLCVEILANKRRILQGKRDVDANELIKTTDLINDSDRATLKKLFIDRGHIAHGRQFHILGRDTSIKIETHIECVRQLVNGYLHSLTPGSWPTGGINIGKSGNKNS